MNYIQICVNSRDNRGVSESFIGLLSTLLEKDHAGVAIAALPKILKIKPELIVEEALSSISNQTVYFRRIDFVKEICR